MRGSITKRSYTRPDGTKRTRWRAQVPRAGKAIERTFETKKEAAQWVAATQSSINAGSFIDPALGKRTFADTAAEWSDTHTDLGPRTKQGYKSLTRLINVELGDHRLSELSPQALQAYVNDLATTRSPATVRRYFTTINLILKMAVQRRYIPANPTTSVKLPKPAPKKPTKLYLTPAEVAALADATGPRWRTAILVAAWTGVRAGELWALRRQDVDMAARTLTIDESLKDVGGHLEFGPPKTANSNRTIALPQGIADLLAEHLQTIPDEPTALLFASTTGTPVRHNLFYRRDFRPACEAALPTAKQGLRFHDLRHVHVALSLSLNNDIYAISKRLGHASIQITLDTYGDLLPSTDEALAESLNALYQQAALPASTGPINTPAVPAMQLTG